MPHSELKHTSHTTFTPEDWEIICAEIEASPLNIEKICRSLGLNDRSQIYRYMRLNPKAEERYRKAWEIRAHTIRDEQEVRQDEWEEEAKHPNVDISAIRARAALGRLRLDKDKFLIETGNPEAYSPKISVDHSGTVNHEIKGRNLAWQQRKARLEAQQAIGEDITDSVDVETQDDTNHEDTSV